jgi:dephospho-CoA kinase
MHLPRLIGLVGVRRSGKDTAAQILDNIGYRNIKFAEPLKAMLRTYLEYAGVNANHIERIIDGDLKEASREVFGHRSARYAMQTLGTEWGRQPDALQPMGRPLRCGATRPCSTRRS